MLCRVQRRMAGLISCVLSLISKEDSFDHYYKHAFGLPFPQSMHVHADTIQLSSYNEVFVIGDVHGCYDELVALLKHADVLEDSTLKVFVGDLVNKGPKSHEVLELLQNSKSMIAVRGNHDEIVLKEYCDAQKSDYQLKDSDRWIKDLSFENINFLSELPYTISLEPLNAVIVHAGLIPGLPLRCNDPQTMVTMRNLVVRDYFWEGGIQAVNNTSEGSPWASMWPGPIHVYFGHDAKRMLQLYPYATGLDTGCVYGNQLTGLFISGHRKGTFVSVNAFKMYNEPKTTKK